MLFSSLVFIFVFLPLILASYYLLRTGFRNYVLLIGSLLFYAWGGVSYSLILVGSIIANHLFVRAIETSINYKKTWLVTGLIVNTLVIVTFKYLDFFIENINALFSIFSNEVELMEKRNIILPLGISFFTFQQMSLLWDIYRDPFRPRTTFLNNALYISFFPQLIAGPIVRYNDIIDQIKTRKESSELFRSGIQRFILGLFKKIVFANTCGRVADSIMTLPVDELSSGAAWLGIICYSLQIYFDFSGYSDMAIGLGRMFGFNILENFNFPYISRSIKEFWRRWHISLSSWFRDYVYIPLGGSRKSNVRTYVNLITVFLITGFWHGSTWSFVLWGAFHGVFLIIEKIGFDKTLSKIPAPLSWMYTIIIVMIGWVLFRVEEIDVAVNYIFKLFSFDFSAKQTALKFLDKEALLIIIIATLSSSRFFEWSKERINRINIIPSLVYNVSKDLFLISLLLYSVILINSGSYNPFIYFRF